MARSVRYDQQRRSAVSLRQRMNARISANRAQQTGTLKAKPCEVCGTVENVQKHHEDYDKPLEVRWLCGVHHGEVTRAQRRMPITEALVRLDLDRATWFTKHEVAARLQVSTKTVERWAVEDHVQQAQWRRPHGGPLLVVYHPQDVARLVLKHPPKALPAYLVPDEEAPQGEPAPPDRALQVTAPAAEAPITTAEELVRAFTALLRSAVESVPLMSQTSPQMSETSERLFLTLQQASAYSGLTQAYLRRKCVDGTLPAIRDPGWRIRRKDLEAL